MTKIEALEKTIYNLENDVYEYSWISVDNCNCGLVAKTMLNGKEPTACGLLDSTVIDFQKYFGFCSMAVCMTTDLPMPLVFQTLKDAGFTFNELYELENLSNERIINKLNWELNQYGTHTTVGYPHSRTCKEDLISYLKAWVEILKEESPQMLSKEQEAQASVATEDHSSNAAGTTKTIIKYVSVPETIKEQSKELILS